MSYIGGIGARYAVQYRMKKSEAQFDTDWKERPGGLFWYEHQAREFMQNAIDAFGHVAEFRIVKH